MNQLTSDRAGRRSGGVAAVFLAATIIGLYAWPAAAALSLDEAVTIAQRNDPWILGSEYRQDSLAAQAVAAGTLPDPMVDLSFANMPTDTFDFDQEAMTQFKVGIAQAFPRGDTRALSQRRLAMLGEQFPYQRDDRRARLAVDVAVLWLETYRARESIRLIEQDRELFEHLVDVAESNYASAMGRTRQQDLVRAQLELTRLEDRLNVLHERQDAGIARLGEWLRPGPDAGSGQFQWEPASYSSPALAEGLPTIDLRHPELFQSGMATPNELAALLQAHPAIASLDRKIDAGGLGVKLAEQKYLPQWRVNASYGYREGDPMGGRDRPDLFSVGVGFDLPLFTSRRQDREVQSAIADTEALRTEKILALRGMVASFETQYARLQRIEQRQQLYRDRLLREMEAQAEASLTAYTNDDGDFAEVVRARIAGLNARIEALDIEIDRLQAIARLNYFFTSSSVETGGESS